MFFLKLSCFFDDPADVGNLISGSSAFSKTIWKFTVHILLRPGLENFEHYFTSIRRRQWHPTPVLLGFPCGSAGKESICKAGDLGSIPGLGRSPGKEKGYPCQYSGLENPMDGGAWWATVPGVAKSQTRLSDFTSFTFCWELGVPAIHKGLGCRQQKPQTQPALWGWEDG